MPFSYGRFNTYRAKRTQNPSLNRRIRQMFQRFHLATVHRYWVMAEDDETKIYITKDEFDHRSKKPSDPCEHGWEKNGLHGKYHVRPYRRSSSDAAQYHLGELTKKFYGNWEGAYMPLVYQQPTNVSRRFCPKGKRMPKRDDRQWREKGRWIWA